MDSVATAIIGFIFVCIVMPHIVKHRHQFYMALVLMLVAMFGTGAAMIIGNQGFRIFMSAVVIILEAMAVLLLVMAAGGLTARELAGNMVRAYEVMRRGETEKEIIIPTGPAPGGKKDEEERPPRQVIDEPRPGRDKDQGPIPFE